MRQELGNQPAKARGHMKYAAIFFALAIFSGCSREDHSGEYELSEEYVLIINGRIKKIDSERYGFHVATQKSGGYYSTGGPVFRANKDSEEELKSFSYIRETTPSGDEGLYQVVVWNKKDGGTRTDRLLVYIWDK